MQSSDEINLNDVFISAAQQAVNLPQDSTSPDKLNQYLDQISNILKSPDQLAALTSKTLDSTFKLLLELNLDDNHPSKERLRDILDGMLKQELAIHQKEFEEGTEDHQIDLHVAVFTGHRTDGDINYPDFSDEDQSINPNQFNKSKTLASDSPKVFKPQSRSFLEWIFTSERDTFFGIFSDRTYAESYEAISTANYVKQLLLDIFGFDGYNAIEKKGLAVDGNYQTIDSTRVGWGILFSSLFGLPNRPKSINKSGKPILTATQLLLTNWVGGWTLSLNSKTWTLSQFLELPIKFLIILPINIIRVPINIAISIIKIITLAPSRILAKVLIDLDMVLLVWFSTLLASEQNLAIKGIGGFILLIPTIATAILQYAAVWAVRLAELLTTPAISASKAFALGRSLKISRFGPTAEKWISNIMGVIGWGLSVTLSAILLTLILPLVFSAITTLFPAIVPAIASFTHLSVISASIAWVSQFPVVMGTFTAASNLFATVGTALGVAFGPMITPVATMLGLQISTMAMTVGTTLGMLGTGVIIAGNYIVDGASYLWVKLHSNPDVALKGSSTPINDDDVQQNHHSQENSETPSPEVVRATEASKDSVKEASKSGVSATRTASAVEDSEKHEEIRLTPENEKPRIKNNGSDFKP